MAAVKTTGSLKRAAEMQQQLRVAESREREAAAVRPRARPVVPCRVRSTTDAGAAAAAPTGTL